MTERRLFRVTGTVQGVGFRPFVYRLAVDLGLAGCVGNDSDGVFIEAQGGSDGLDELARRLWEETPPLARVERLDATTLPVCDGDGGFRIVDSRAEGAPAVAVSVDVATCDDCLAELLDPGDRRYAYPFINCTNCGPRYTIIRSIPYDRASTTMAGFVMCDACRAEYENPADRRFHAEPNACPLCGPELRLLGPEGRVLATEADALDEAAALLASGHVLAVKGLGGYHLAADATDPGAVGELRRRKARDDKPFAVMVADVEHARRLCRLTPAAEAELASARRPILLAPRLRGAEVAPAVAPGLPELGLMLPYTPLHHLLVAAVSRPLVMTSGNLSDEPIAHDDTDALERLGPLVDAVLTHDRPIHIRCDDSVVRALTSPPLRAGRQGDTETVSFRGPEPGERTGDTQMVRRSRGYAPEPLLLPRPTSRQLLTVGAELKNTVAVAKGTTVVASHHIGDLEHLPAYRSFLQAVGHLSHLAGVEPDLVAHDLHPEYLSTKFAMELDLPSLAVQHHHAHIVSCLVEHGRTEPVLGVAFDGLGMGTDGTLWGGELLVADLTRYRRVGHLRSVALPGGNQAVREPWRMALVWAAAALGEEVAERYGEQVDERWPAVLALSRHANTPVTSSAGRLFDAVAALLGLRSRVSYEAQAAIELEACAAGVPLSHCPGYDLAVTRDADGLVLDPSPILGRVLADRDAGDPPPLISARFHDGLGRGVALAAAELAGEAGLDTVALSGGVFQNARLTSIVRQQLEHCGLAVLVHRRVPPNDGGISIGQAGVAAAANPA
ncbi:MAG: carbamoyltransferase HypF [Actinomycetota bacterium]|nr:carbamoyltransferase HypF [Actinomycetota bacterium]